MKYRNYILAKVIIGITFSFGIFSFSPKVQSNGDLVVKIENIKNDQGQIMIALANNKAVYDDKNDAYKSAKVSIEDGKAVFVFRQIPWGEYAVKVFHDANSNEKLDTNLMGIPKEDYGFSNNAKGTFGPPAFEDASFSLDQPEKTISIRMI
ncbi:MAG: DUF2141 domain-containing protein [Candidatus Cyclobacteriaceae bacterium M3_2C_046]